MCEGLGQWPGAGSTRNGIRKRTALAATHLPLDVDSRYHRRVEVLRAPTARMAKSSPPHAKMPVSKMEVKKVVTGPGTSGKSVYLFAWNILTLACQLMAPAHIAGHDT